MLATHPGARVRQVALAILLVGGPGAAAATPLSDELQEALRGADPQDRMAVIITFSERVDTTRFRDGDRATRRAELIRALRERAARSQAGISSLLHARGARKLRQLWVNNSLAVELPASAIRELERVPGIESIRSDALLSAPAPSSVTATAPEWHLSAIRAPELWSLGYSGSGMVVANMDTGVDADHPDLSTRWRGNANGWYDPNGEHATPYDRQGHGTQTMGLMVGGAAGGTAIGVAPDAQWIAVKIFNDAGYTTLSAIHQGFQWLLDPDGDPATDDAPDVVNNSWGLQNPGGCNMEFNDDIRALKAAGIAVVFAGGNSGPSLVTGESPANNPAGFAVGAVDSTLTVAGFSSRGPSSCDGTYFPEITAPGVAVKTTDLSFGGLPLYATASGASFAAPQVAGAFVLLAQAFPAASVAELEAALKSGGQDRGVTGPDYHYGYGVADLLASFNLLAANPPVEPTPPENRAPAANADLYTAQAATILTVAAPGLLANDTDPDGDPLSVTLASPPSGGTLSLNSDGSFSYMPASGTTSDAFSYRSSDGVLLSAPAQVSITVVSNQPPAAADDAYTVAGGVTTTIPAPGVLGNDRDPDGGKLTALLASSTTGGSLLLNADGSFSYRPWSTTTSDSFTYQASDGVQMSAPVTVSISVSSNKPPLAASEIVYTFRNVPITIKVLANDRDPDGTLDPASITIATAPNRGGSVAVNGDGTVTYRPKQDFVGIESFGYTVKDTLGAVSNKATVTVRVR